MAKGIMQWFKVLTRMSEWPPAMVLNNRELGIWIRIMGLASASPERGRLLLAEGMPHTKDTLVETLKLNGDDQESLEALWKKMFDIGYLRNGKGDIVELPHWGIEQGRPAPSAEPDRVRDRVRGYRERQRAGLGVAPPEEELGALERTEEALGIWVKALEEIKMQVTETNFSTWLVDTAGLGFQNGDFVVGVPSPFAVEWLQKQMRSLIQKTLLGVTGQHCGIRFALVPTAEERK